MDNTKKNKKFWLLFFLALILIGLFLYFWFFRTKEEPKIPVVKQGEVNLPVSVIYRYDFKKEEYLFDEGGSWQNSNFSRYIYDSAPEGLELSRCYYFLYDNLTKQRTGGGIRKCNSNLTIAVGENQNCSSQGENTCTLYVYAIDTGGQEGKMTSATYNIDWERPKVGKIFTKEKEIYPIKVKKGETEIFSATVSDNIGIEYCWFYLSKTQNTEQPSIKKMKIDPFPCEENKECIAFIDYIVDGEESQTSFIRCADHYDTEKGEYLNLTYGESTEIVIPVNHPPKVSSCKVTPTQGNLQVNFKFQVVAIDPDDNQLSFLWDFGDGQSSNEENPTHYYQGPGTYQPKITVFDEEGEKDVCSTAWVVVSEQ